MKLYHGTAESIPLKEIEKTVKARAGKYKNPYLDSEIYRIWWSLKQQGLESTFKSWLPFT